MKLAEFGFTLPKELIAQYPVAKRSQSRLLVLSREEEELAHRQFVDLLDYLQAGDLLVLNNSKVIPARLYGQKVSGGKIEILVERVQGEHRCLAHVRASKAPSVGTRLLLEGGLQFDVLGRQQDLFELKLLNDAPLIELLEQHGHIPLPPYMEREDEALDRERYQTVFAEHHGSVAAPTAGLHFDDDLLEKIKAKGVKIAYVTLHVGAGTFQPVRVENILDHQMHYEYLEVPEDVAAAAKKTKSHGGRVVAVGTTSVRSLESAATEGEIKAFHGESNLFIYPGYQFNVVDAMVTNFHLPKSSLLMLVSAFAGLKNVKQAYKEAIAEQYRFYSYGDAMLLL